VLSRTPSFEFLLSLNSLRSLSRCCLVDFCDGLVGLLYISDLPSLNSSPHGFSFSHCCPPLSSPPIPSYRNEGAFSFMSFFSQFPQTHVLSDWLYENPSLVFDLPKKTKLAFFALTETIVLGLHLSDHAFKQKCPPPSERLGIFLNFGPPLLPLFPLPPTDPFNYSRSRCNFQQSRLLSTPDPPLVPLLSFKESI